MNENAFCTYDNKQANCIVHLTYKDIKKSVGLYTNNLSVTSLYWLTKEWLSWIFTSNPFYDLQEFDLSEYLSDILKKRPLLPPNLSIISIPNQIIFVHKATKYFI